jgi:hypothetical protein
MSFIEWLKTQPCWGLLQQEYLEQMIEEEEE